ncbi:hypothetical protein ES703_77253 [subsurface metagenome]
MVVELGDVPSKCWVDSGVPLTLISTSILRVPGITPSWLNIHTALAPSLVLPWSQVSLFISIQFRASATSASVLLLPVFSSATMAKEVVSGI